MPRHSTSCEGLSTSRRWTWPVAIGKHPLRSRTDIRLPRSLSMADSMNTWKCGLDCLMPLGPSKDWWMSYLDDTYGNGCWFSWTMCLCLSSAKTRRNITNASALFLKPYAKRTKNWNPTSASCCRSKWSSWAMWSHQTVRLPTPKRSPPSFTGLFSRLWNK